MKVILEEKDIRDAVIEYIERRGHTVRYKDTNTASVFLRHTVNSAGDKTYYIEMLVDTPPGKDGPYR